jgi:voltage-gated potassium channel
LFVSTIVAYGLYFNEADIEGSSFRTYEESLWYALGQFNVIDSSPSTLVGKVIASFLLFVNLIFVSTFISFMTLNIGNIMSSLKQGRVGISSMQNHIVICGYTTSSKLLVKNLLLNKDNFNNIIMITLRDDPDIDGTLYLYGDFSDGEVLLKANIEHARVCIVFGEIRENDTLDNADMRTVLTVFNIENDYGSVHTIAEIYDPKKAKLVQEKMGGDEVFFKSAISADIINTSVKYPHISRMINELLSPTGKCFQKKELHDFDLPMGATFKDVKIKCADLDFIALGVMCENEFGPPTPKLSPPNSFVLDERCKIIVVG